MCKEIEIERELSFALLHICLLQHIQKIMLLRLVIISKIH